MRYYEWKLRKMAAEGDIVWEEKPQGPDYGIQATRPPLKEWDTIPMEQEGMPTWSNYPLSKMRQSVKAGMPQKTVYDAASSAGLFTAIPEVPKKEDYESSSAYRKAQQGWLTEVSNPGLYAAYNKKKVTNDNYYDYNRGMALQQASAAGIPVSDWNAYSNIYTWWGANQNRPRAIKDFTWDTGVPFNPNKLPANLQEQYNQMSPDAQELLPHHAREAAQVQPQPNLQRQLDPYGQPQEVVG